MEPVTITAATIGALVLNKAFEKVGEALGQTALDKGGKLAKLLRHKLPAATTTALERAEPSADYSQALLEVETVAQRDDQVKEAIREVAEAIQSQPSGVTNFGKIANQYLAPVIIQQQNITL